MKTKVYLIFLIVLSLFSCKIKKEIVRVENGNSKINIHSVRNAGSYSNFTGQVKELLSGESLPFVNVLLYGGDRNHFGTTTDWDGNFTIKNVPPGEYTLSITYAGYDKIETTLTIKKSSNYTLEAMLSQHQSYIEKPVIYLYPSQKQEITVKINYQGQLVHTYPAYPERGWKVIAEPDGTLWDEKGQEYYALFWEGLPKQPIIPKEGFIVPGNETAPFLEEKLAYLGLNRREANEFILYWLPRMENSPYNLIHFSGIEYEKSASLNITPKPETIIRVMMLTQPLKSKIDFPLQDITSLKINRKGFTVVEWGGSVVNHLKEGI